MVKVEFIAAALAVLLLSASAATAKVKLQNDADSRAKIIAWVQAEDLAKQCKRLKLNGPVVLAMPLYFALDAGQGGYSPTEIGEAKQALASEAHQGLLAKGAVDGKSRTFCAVGNAEKRAGSMIGRMFK
ncbi:MAG: DUF5333 family protein [Deltaproteobacteria bacterium]